MSDKKSLSQVAELQIKKKWIPILIALLLCSLTMVLWWILENREELNRQISINTEAQRVLNIINVDIHHRIQALQRIVKRWEIRGATIEKEFLNDTEAYIVLIATKN